METKTKHKFKNFAIETRFNSNIDNLFQFDEQWPQQRDRSSTLQTRQHNGIHKFEIRFKIQSPWQIILFYILFLVKKRLNFNLKYNFFLDFYFSSKSLFFVFFFCLYNVRITSILGLGFFGHWMYKEIKLGWKCCQTFMNQFCKVFCRLFVI